MAMNAPMNAVELRERINTARATHYSGNFAEALAMLRALTPELPGVGDLALAAECHLWASHVEVRLGNLSEALHAATLASLLARRAARPDIEGKALTELAMHDYFCGYPDRGAALAGQSIERLGADGEPLWLEYGWMALAENLLMQGDYDAARVAAQHAVIQGIRSGADENEGDSTDPQGAMGTVALAWVDALTGHALRGAERCQALTHTEGRLTLAPYCGGYEGYCWLEHGDAARALPLLQTALASIRSWGFKPVAALFAAWVADAQRQLGLEAQCRASLDLSSELCGVHPHAMARGWRLRTEALLASGAERAQRLDEAALAFRLVGAMHEAARTLEKL